VNEKIDRLERLIDLTAVLRATKRPLTLEEIVETVPGYPDRKDSYRRQFERDKETLRGMGVPIVVERSDYDEVDGYRIPDEEYALPDLGLTDAEQRALVVAVGAVRLEGGREAMWKLGGGATDTPSLAALPTPEHLGDLFAAVRDRALITFDYRDDSRTVEPYGLVFRRGRWYVVGFDRGREAPRSFRVDRMGSVAVGSAGAFERPALDAADLLRDDPMTFADEPPVTATVAVDPALVAEVQARVQRAPSRPGADGRVEFEIEVSNRDAFRSFVLDLLDGAEVLSPPDLREEIITWLAREAGEGSAQ